MIEDAAAIIALIQNAGAPADVFGPYTQDPADLRAAKRAYRIYANAVHPDRTHVTGLNPVAAAAAFARLGALHQQWMHQSPRGAESSGTASVIITSSTDRYTLGSCIAKGTIANIYRATNRSGQRVAVKIPRAAASSRFLDGERQALGAIEKLCAAGDNSWLVPYFPRLVDTATHRSDAGEDRAVNILADLSRAQGYVTLAAVKDALPEGLDGRDWAWIFRRLLRAVAGAHLAGVVHGAVLPENVLIHPDGHGIVLAGWSFATTPGLAVAGQVGTWRNFYPPEASSGACAATDVYMAAALMDWILGPEEHEQRRFARGCMQNAPRMRPPAADLLHEYDALLEKLYGARAFRRFPYTVDATSTA